MSGETYKIIELAGTSSNSIEEAISHAIQRADKTLDNLNWFEIVQTRGKIGQGKVVEFQVVLKIGFQVKD